MRRELLRVGMSQVRPGGGAAASQLAPPQQPCQVRSFAAILPQQQADSKPHGGITAGPLDPAGRLLSCPSPQMSAGSKTDVGAYHRDDSPATEENLADLQASGAVLGLGLRSAMQVIACGWRR